jgi:hypothetical protein
MHIISI